MLNRAFLIRQSARLVLATALLAATSAVPAIAQPNVSIGAVAAAAGSTARVPLMLSGTAGAIHAVSADLTYDATALAIADPSHSCAFSNLPPHCVTNVPTRVCSDGSHSCAGDRDCSSPATCTAVRLGV